MRRTTARRSRRPARSASCRRARSRWPSVVETRKEDARRRTWPTAIQGGFITGYGGQIKPTCRARASSGRRSPNSTSRSSRRSKATSRSATTTTAISAARPIRNSACAGSRRARCCVRGSYGTGFLAPSAVSAVHAEHRRRVASRASPIRSAARSRDDRTFDCNTQFSVLFGGNPNLKPENPSRRRPASCSSRFPNASFSVDYFKINLKNAITNGISPIDDPRRPRPVRRVSSRAARPIRTSRTCRARSRRSCRRTSTSARSRSRASTSRATTARRRMSWGRLSFDAVGHVLHQVRQPAERRLVSGARSARRSSSRSTGVIPRWKHYVSATWDHGPWSATLAQTYQTSYTDQQTDLDGNLAHGRLAVAVGPAGLVHGLQEPQAHAGREEPVRHAIRRCRTSRARSSWASTRRTTIRAHASCTAASTTGSNKRRKTATRNRLMGASAPFFSALFAPRNGAIVRPR